MLSEKQIDDYYDSLSQYFLDQNTYSIKLSEFWGKTTILKSGLGRMVAIAKEPMTIKSLANEHFEPKYSFYTKPDANYDIWVEKKKCWKWIHDYNTQQWTKNLNIQNEEELYHLILINQKVALLDRIHEQVSFYRNKLTNCLDGQLTIYTWKYLEAKEVIQNNLTEDEFLKYPFVKGYADVCNIPFQQAAKEILLNHEIQSGFLAESESLRIKYTNFIRNEKDIKNLTRMLNNFETENFKLGSV